MRINNRKRTVKLKRIFYLVSIVIALTTLVVFLIGTLLQALIPIGVFSIWYLYFHVADYQFIEYHDENGKIQLRYFKAISFGKQSYNEIEFPHDILKKAHFENSVFGRKSDLTLFVKTKRGIAEYPTISLSSLSVEDREKIAASLNHIILN